MESRRWVLSHLRFSRRQSANVIPQLFFSVSLCLSVSLSLCLSVSLYLCTSASLYLCISVFLSLCLSVSLSLSLFLSVTVYLSVFLFVCLFLCMVVWRFSFFLCACLSVCPGASIPSEAMLHFPPVSHFPLFPKKISDSAENFP